ncbi:hypothetical protein JQX13_46250 [Archangium violaceum]|uniref:hypothetical protein n=1 Tax=Archangium violaceum TaxID=83451 RepID=UPI00193C4724|nr:hypothetical protein [Archangium violaceum]QRK07358.1 hypothetical protein JQX13_46250 [Archangium violaceum]
MSCWGRWGACSFRKISKDAASGAIEALGEPGQEEEFRRKVSRLADQLVDDALENPTPGPREIGRETAGGMLEGVEGYLAQEGQGARLAEAGAGFAQELVPVLSAELRHMAPTSRLIFEESGRGLVDGLSSRREEIAALMGEIADEVGRSMARAMAEQLRAELRQQLVAPSDPALTRAVEGVAYRAAAAGVRGATDELGQTVPACKDGPCAPQVVSQLSRSALGGALAAMVPVVLVGLGAFVVGVVVAALAARALSRRHATRRA